MLPYLDESHPVFPPPETALREPDGLLAAGGNLRVETLLDAYRRGIFPWYEQGQPLLWWSPATRALLRPGDEHVGRTMAKSLARGSFQITTDRVFGEVIEACAAPRQRASGTWITPAMVAAYQRLHRAGFAHSLECWRDSKLVGGLYGIQVGGLFCGESMFSLEPNASKTAFIALSRTLARHGFSMIDCQIPNPHLASLGVQAVSREEFLAVLANHRDDTLAWPCENDFTASLTVLVS